MQYKSSNGIITGNPIGAYISTQTLYGRELYIRDNKNSNGKFEVKNNINYLNKEVIISENFSPINLLNDFQNFAVRNGYNGSIWLLGLEAAFPNGIVNSDYHARFVRKFGPHYRDYTIDYEISTVEKKERTKIENIFSKFHPQLLRLFDEFVKIKGMKEYRNV